MATEAQNYKPENGVLCIRDDGMLVMANQKTQTHSMGTIRPYHGDPMASLEQRLLYLQGFNPTKGASVQAAVEQGKFDVETASRADLIEYAQDEFGEDVAGLKTRKEVYLRVQALIERDRIPPKSAPAASGIEA